MSEDAHVRFKKCSREAYEHMAIYSFVPYGLSFEKVEIECALVPGPPGIQILGCPDTLVKESSWRVPAALLAAGFELPLTEKILINLKPHSLKKNWSQLELAMAVSILKATGQASHLPDHLVAVGSLNLSGGIETQISDIKLLPLTSSDLLFLSEIAETEAQTVAVKNLKDFNQPFLYNSGSHANVQYVRPEDSNVMVSEEWARWMLWISVERLNCLLAGTPGTGKSTFAHKLWTIHSPIDDEQFKQTQLFHRRLNKELQWSPFIQPHHSTTPLAFIGGGQPIRPGAVTLAHSGVLVMDEYLEFKPEVQESLREPLESKTVHLMRGSDYQVLPSDFLLIATTNLCPCGNWLPQKFRSSNTRCKCSQTRLSKYQHRLRGPVLDRFDLMIYFDKKPKGGEVSADELFGRRQEVLAFKNSKKNLDWNSEALNYITQLNLSMRRQRALKRTAEAAAWVELSATVQVKHLIQVMPYSVGSFDNWLS